MAVATEYSGEDHLITRLASLDHRSVGHDGSDTITWAGHEFDLLGESGSAVRCRDDDCSRAGCNVISSARSSEHSSADSAGVDCAGLIDLGGSEYANSPVGEPATQNVKYRLDVRQRTAGEQIPVIEQIRVHRERDVADHSAFGH